MGFNPRTHLPQPQSRHTGTFTRRGISQTATAKDPGSATQRKDAASSRKHVFDMARTGKRVGCESCTLAPPKYKTPARNSEPASRLFEAGPLAWPSSALYVIYHNRAHRSSKVSVNAGFAVSRKSPARLAFHYARHPGHDPARLRGIVSRAGTHDNEHRTRFREMREAIRLYFTSRRAAPCRGSRPSPEAPHARCSGAGMTSVAWICRINWSAIASLDRNLRFFEWRLIRASC